MSELPRYQPTSKPVHGGAMKWTCPKCGHRTHSVQHLAALYSSVVTNGTTMATLTRAPDVLLVTCNRCGWKTLMRPADACE